ncbi:MAG: type II toxin-antitoxin system PemK/MazF family toxin [Gemmataceae bacterium]|nr:type II toxin-antitoxin system PemK/MazF family toxin [Gemmataceae bacterium]
MLISRGEVYFVELGPTRGHELNDKRRPVAVVSINDINHRPWVVTVVPGRTYRLGKRVFKNQVKVEPSSENGLEVSTLFECVQIKALDYLRFDRVAVGCLSPQDVLEIEKVIRRCLGLM